MIVYIKVEEYRMEFNYTFSPMKIGNMTVKNRLVVPAMDSGYTGEDGSVIQETVEYYSARARGGFGMIIVEIATVTSKAASMPNELDISDDQFIPGLKKLSDSIKGFGARAVIQLHHAGREMLENPKGPSPVPSILSRVTPQEFTRDEIYTIIEEYIDAAARVKKAGFDAVELHAGHGYLPSQFISPKINKRTDEFGGTIVGRMYFVELIVKGIKKRCGSDYPIIVRISSSEFLRGGIHPNEAVVQSKLIESYGADAVHVSLGTYGTWEYNVPTNDMPEALNLPSVAAVKKAVNIPVIAVGKFVEPLIIENAIATEQTDFVALGRQSISDANFANKMFSGQLFEITPCLSCNQRCLGHSEINHSLGVKGVSCILNPLASCLSGLEILLTDHPKKVMIIGAGPAGLEAGWILAKRGHDVTIFEKNHYWGGHFYIGGFPPYKQRIIAAIRHYVYMCEKYGVKFEMGKEATKDTIASFAPDSLIIATGSKPLLPPIKGIDNKNLLLGIDVLVGKEHASGKALVIGGGLIGVETAEYCLDYCNQVTVVEMMDDYAIEMSLMQKNSLVRRFKEEGVIVCTSTKVLEFFDDGVLVEKNGEKFEMRGYQSVILAMGAESYNPLDDCKDLAPDVHIIGDAKKAKSAVEAIHEAAMLSLKL